MNEDQIKAIIRWLDADKYPLLVQGPQEVVSTLLEKVTVR